MYRICLPLLIVLTVIGCTPSAEKRQDVQIITVSSNPELVSGNIARVEIHIPENVDSENILVKKNDIDVTDAFTLVSPGILGGVVRDLDPGENILAAEFTHNQDIREASLTITNHSSTGPMFSGPAQEPFQCATPNHRAAAGLGDILDDQCSVDTVVSFLYKSTSTDSFQEFDHSAPLPEDIATTVTLEGDTVNYIVRWERGTINRFIYSIALLSPERFDVETPDLSAWNRRLIYYFQGGVGIGHYQGSPSRQRMLYDHGLSKGYAIVYSTGTRTSTHYNLELGGETAIMTKDRFVSMYGKPLYTVGVGGSGGAIQQYIYGQNHPGLIDAAIPQYSYPDMITQTIHVGDCELLERYMDAEVAIRSGSKWATWSNRQWLQGLNASDSVRNPYNGNQPGSTECIKGWRGLTPLTFNPHYGTAPGIVPEQQVATEWTHFDDLVQIYGTDEHGFARRTWDNIGVQYGLQALHDDKITPEEFLDLNARIGGWKAAHESVQEGQPYLPDSEGIDIHSARNMTLSPDDAGIEPAPRTLANSDAVEAAYDHGLVFTGNLDIPVIDWRHYLERELDMHNAHQSFAARQRMLNHDGDASNQVIWFTDVSNDSPRFDQTPLAFEVIDEWMQNINTSPDLSVHENKPARAEDSCFDSEGNLIDQGEDVWSGILSKEIAGSCTERFPLFSTSRIIAGGPITGDVFKCHLQSIENAIQQGVYGSWELSTSDISRLQEIFPEGVCDYSLNDQFKPSL